MRHKSKNKRNNGSGSCVVCGLNCARGKKQCPRCKKLRKRMWVATVLNNMSAYFAAKREIDELKGKKNGSGN